ncbi:MAG: hypothetical protein GY847_28770 [Proteobacteria bacterium]|nr:hypothetical protein [Pseudomonadota bacterium]
MKTKTTVWIDGHVDDAVTVGWIVTDNDEAAVLLGYADYNELHVATADYSFDSPLNFMWEE